MKKKIHILIISFVLLTLNYGCLKDSNKTDYKNSSSFKYSGVLSSGEKISFKILVEFNSQTNKKTALIRSDQLHHAFNMTIPIYSRSQIKGSRLKILIKDILRQVFRNTVKSFEINSLAIE